MSNSNDIAIQGDWGSGKTSVMKMVDAKILNDRANSGIYPVWFNTWQYSQFNTSDNLALTMVETIVNGLKIKDESADEKGKKPREILKASLKTIGTVAKGAALFGSEKVLGSMLTGKLESVLGLQRLRFCPCP